MSAWNGTILALLCATYDSREEVHAPPMSVAEMKRFAKMALQHMPGAHRTFNDVFGATKKASDFPAPRLLDAGVPTFLWCAK